ncbi:hypothetical protein ACP179_03370 [Xenorhabdus stockiae]
MPDLLSKKIDDQVKTSPNLYKNRSHFLPGREHTIFTAF